MAVLVLPACGGASAADDSAPAPTRVVVAEEVDGMEALISGRLTATGGCLGIDEQLTVFPVGTTVLHPDPLQIEIPGRGKFTIGDSISLGGGHTSPTTDTEGRQVAAGTVIPAECAGSRVIVTH
ncbi:hypothetical protein ACFOLH_18480 [Aquipuribacter hungaricus]|uniref:Lipoprotein n=1 Tax=Aquipuribacter hungaricus TaxID=545624 RepID=A0ABV7WKN2_9MICO